MNGTNRLGILGVMLLLASSAAAQPKPQGSKLFPEVFDDEWTPPVRAEPKPIEPATRPATRPAPQPGTVKPKTPDAVPPIAPVPAPVPEAPTEPGTPPPPVLLEIPAADELMRTRKVMRDVFAEQLKDRSPAGRQKLVEALVEEAEKQRDQPVDRYVLLSAVLQAAREAGDVTAVVNTADELARQFKVDALAIKAEVAGQTQFKAADPGSTAENLNAGFALVDDLLAEDDFYGASRLAQAMQTAAATDAASRAALIQRLRDINARKAAFDRLVQATERLRTAPDDPAALLIVGSHLCFEKGRWTEGLEMLSRCGSPAIKSAAVTDLAAATGAKTPEAAGDAWWAIAEREPVASAQSAIKERAVVWYRKALESEAIAGLNRTRIQKRIDDHQAQQGPVRIVLDNDKAEFRGEWVGSRQVSGFVGEGYMNDANRGKGQKSATFRTTIPRQGSYAFRVSYAKGPERATNIPVTVSGAVGGKKTVIVDQTKPYDTKPFKQFAMLEFAAGALVVIEISTAGTNSYVIVDAIELELLETPR